MLQTAALLALVHASFVARELPTHSPGAAPIGAAEDARAESVPSSFYWGDVDGDTLEDAFAVLADGRTMLLLNRGDGSFADITQAAGLHELADVTLAVVADLDGDADVDLYVGTHGPAPRFYRNHGNASFDAVDSHIDHVGTDLGVRVLDFDADGRADLEVHTDRGELLYQNLGDARFQRVELPRLTTFAAPAGATRDGAPSDASADGDGSRAGRRTIGADRTDTRPVDAAGGRRARERAPRDRDDDRVSSLFGGSVDANAAGGSSQPLATCVLSVKDSVSGLCLDASTTPALGRLYPLSTSLNVDSSGRVGMGTSTPAHRLHVLESSATGVFAQGGTTGVRGEANLAGSGNRYGGYFTSTGGTNNIGVYATSSIGVYGIGLSGGYGVFGETNAGSSVGVYGRTNHTTATTTGVLGEASSTVGIGVHGKALATSGVNYGVFGETSSSLGHGLVGSNSATSAGTGVAGRTSGATGTGVLGFTLATGATDTPIGVRGFTIAAKGVGVLGESANASATDAGVKGTSVADFGVGVRGDNSFSWDENTSGDFAAGVWGSANGGVGVRGSSKRPAPTENGMPAVVGGFDNGGGTVTLSNSGVSGSTDTAGGAGVFGHASAGEAGVLGAHSDTDGIGVRGDGNGDGLSLGVRGQSYADGGAGVWGEVDGDNAIGVVAVASSVAGGATALAATVGASVVYVAGVGVSGVTDVDNAAGVAGVATAAANTGSGVWGDSQSTTGIGVQGTASATSGATTGVLGDTSSTGGVGVRGTYSGSSVADVVAVAGLSAPAANWGIGGEFTGGWKGVRGIATQSGGGFRYGGDFSVSGGDQILYGVHSVADDPQNDGEARAIYGEVPSSADGYAGYFQGNVHVNGTLSKSAGAFVIDHPLDPANKTLTHSFVESPDMKNLYDGVATLDEHGEAWIELPEWFEALNGDFRYQLTAIGARADLWIARKIEGGRFLIAGEVPGLEVSWQVTGTRKDAYARANRLVVEQWKDSEDRGGYMNPEAFGLAAEHGIEAMRRSRAETAKEAQRGKAVENPLAAPARMQPRPMRASGAAKSKPAVKTIVSHARTESAAPVPPTDAAGADTAQASPVGRPTEVQTERR